MTRHSSKKIKRITFHNKKFGQREVDACSQLLNLSSQLPLWQGSELVKQWGNVVSIDGDQQLKM